MKSKKKRWIVILMVVVLVCSTQVYAEPRETLEHGVVQSVGKGREHVVIADGVNVRKTPGLSSIKMGQMYKGDRVREMGDARVNKDGYCWVYIMRLSDGLVGWVALQYLA